MKLLFLDTETTGLEPGTHGVVQIAGIIEIDGEVKEEFDFLCRPFEGQIYDARALEVNKRTMEEIKAFPDPREVYDKIKAIFGKYVDRFNRNDRFTIAGQNVAFDFDMMEAWWNRCGDKYWYAFVDFRGVDIITATALFQAAGHFKLPNMKLETVAAHFGIPLKAHDALHDIRATREIYHRYVNMIRNAYVNSKPMEEVKAS